jgi:hypothetical protein
MAFPSLLFAWRFWHVRCTVIVITEAQSPKEGCGLEPTTTVRYFLCPLHDMRRAGKRPGDLDDLDDLHQSIPVEVMVYHWRRVSGIAGQLDSHQELRVEKASEPINWPWPRPGCAEHSDRPDEFVYADFPAFDLPAGFP